MRSLVIVPTYNEVDNLTPLVTTILAADPTLDVLVVDDGSPDGTGAAADALAAHTPRVFVQHRPGKLGLGTAYVAGFRFALARGYERVVQMDADFSHRPEDIPRLLAASETADVVVGSRSVPDGRVVGWSTLRRVISGGGSRYARFVLNLPVRDCTSGFKCLQRRALEALDLDGIRSNGFAFQVEVNHACARAGLRLVEVPIVFHDRTRGASKMSAGIFLEAAWIVLCLRVARTAERAGRPEGVASPTPISAPVQGSDTRSGGASDAASLPAMAGAVEALGKVA